MNELKDIKEIMMEALDKAEPVDETETGRFLTHVDIPDKTPEGFDDHFLVAANNDVSYLVLIQKIEH